MRLSHIIFVTSVLLHGAQSIIPLELFTNRLGRNRLTYDRAAGVMNSDLPPIPNFVPSTPKPFDARYSTQDSVEIMVKYHKVVFNETHPFGKANRTMTPEIKELLTLLRDDFGDMLDYAYKWDRTRCIRKLVCVVSQQPDKYGTLGAKITELLSQNKLTERKHPLKNSPVATKHSKPVHARNCDAPYRKCSKTITPELMNI